MLTQFRTETASASCSATLAEAETLASLMVEDEAVVSDAPTYLPEAQGLLLLTGLLALSPKAPKAPKEKPAR
ncbi:hypothetical protein [Kitasatospora aureofaciens]|uniref:hypothetical protein n=1 Tax=Kitasatospora aureofaciens TaxID=1894 RepID=UPI000527D9F3|nr:hypothetical protein [Kitasatospora aureofaciens]HJD83654.1 hypothetical protein [Kitasatospora aureofaciens]